MNLPNFQICYREPETDAFIFFPPPDKSIKGVEPTRRLLVLCIFIFGAYFPLWLFIREILSTQHIWGARGLQRGGIIAFFPRQFLHIHPRTSNKLLINSWLMSQVYMNLTNFCARRKVAGSWRRGIYLCRDSPPSHPRRRHPTSVIQ